MLQILPEIVAPHHLIKQKAHLQGYLPLEKMQRLVPAKEVGKVSVDLLFGTDEARINYAKGQAKADVTLVCQRCLEPMVVTLQVDISLGLIRHQAKEVYLPEYYEPLLITDSISLLTLIEDELILVLPFVVTHPQDQCKLIWPNRPEPVTPEPKQRENPFAALAKLKK